MIYVKSTECERSITSNVAVFLSMLKLSRVRCLSWFSHDQIGTVDECGGIMALVESVV